MDLHNTDEFRRLGVELVSISPDRPESWRGAAAEYGVESRVLSDPENRMAERYGVMRWRVPASADVRSAEPGHTFVLVDERGVVRWIRDYGAPENGGLMYVRPAELIAEVDRVLSS